MTVWLGEAEWAGLDASAAAAGVETGALAKEALLRGYASTARDVSAGRVKLRRRSVALEAGRAPEMDAIGPDVQARGPGEPVMDPGVRRALQFRAATSR